MEGKEEVNMIYAKPWELEAFKESNDVFSFAKAKEMGVDIGTYPVTIEVTPVSTEWYIIINLLTIYNSLLFILS